MDIFFLKQGGVCFTCIEHASCDTTTFVVESTLLKLRDAVQFAGAIGVEVDKVMSYLSDKGGYVGTRVYYAFNVEKPECAVIIEEDISMWDWVKKSYHEKK